MGIGNGRRRGRMYLRRRGWIFCENTIETENERCVVVFCLGKIALVCALLYFCVRVFASTLTLHPSVTLSQSNTQPPKSPR